MVFKGLMGLEISFFFFIIFSRNILSGKGKEEGLGGC